MADNFKVGYFLADRGHEVLLKAFVHRLAAEKDFSPENWKDDVRAARGGRSIEAFKRFLRDLHTPEGSFPFEQAVSSSEVYVPFAGYEYGEKIVQEMDIYTATKNDPSLKHFIDDLGSALVRISKLD